MNLTTLETALLPLVGPLVLTLWNGTILPALTAKLKSGSPEIQLVESELIAMLTDLVPAELAKL